MTAREALRLPTASSWHYGKIDNKHQAQENIVDRPAVFARYEETICPGL